MLRKWKKARPTIEQTAEDTSSSVLNIRRAPGAGSKPNLELENRLYDWFKTRREKNLRVKDKYLTRMALSIASDLGLNTFKASKGFLDRFKKRNNIGIRVVTGCRKLPEDASTLATVFLSRVSNLISSLNIKPKNILNLDQVPRYYEREGKRTLEINGSKEVKVAKGSTGHKRFTYTPVISGDGSIAFQHILLSKLKNIPSALADGVIVAVNGTGMWNESIVRDFVYNYLAKRPETSLLREPVLFILDSYGSHLKLDIQEIARKFNIHVLFIPKNMTSILKPLDVVVNRSFQQYYDHKYDEYLDMALINPDYQTKKGNVKIPSHALVSKWCDDWAKQYSPELVKKAFHVCGINSADDSHFHQKLSTVLQGDVVDIVQQNVGGYDDDGVIDPQFDEEKIMDNLIDCLSALPVRNYQDNLASSILSALKKDDVSKTLMLDDDDEVDDAEFDKGLWLYGFTLVTGYSLRVFIQESRHYVIYGNDNEDEILTIVCLSGETGWAVGQSI